MSLGISQKCKAIAPSATFAIDAKANEMRAQGIDVIAFGAGEPDYDTPEKIRNAVKEAMDKGMTHYTAVAGTVELRDAISKWIMREFGEKYTRDQIIVSSGAKQSLYNLFQTILDPEDEVIIPTPCWVSYPEMVSMAGGKPVFLPATEENGFVPTVADIERAISPWTKAFVLTNPSNPTGAVWPEEMLRALGELAVKHDFYIISDEIYNKLVYDGQKAISMPTLGEENKAHTILINGVSKAFAMTGFRIGFAAGPRNVIKGMTTYQSHAASAPNASAQHAAAVAFTMESGEFEWMRASFEERRNTLVELINAIPGLSCKKPKGAFYVMMNHKALIGKKYHGETITDSASFASLILENAHVAMVPGNAFMAEGFCRLSYATSMEKIREGLRRVAEFVGELTDE